MSLQFSFLSDDRWLPKSVLCLRDYSLNKFVRDVTAGITVGLVALPLAMAFAIASGVTPQAGIFTAVIAGFIISALGGTRVSIGADAYFRGSHEIMSASPASGSSNSDIIARFLPFALTLP